MLMCALKGVVVGCIVLRQVIGAMVAVSVRNQVHCSPWQSVAVSCSVFQCVAAGDRRQG